ncbi:protein kinase [Trichocoleus sp. DQ-A3]|uniref:protein kinase domain-containing protein n=1 Tax=Cyanophyceae TaxID=3028117 RepID=UPI00168200D3|nr:protein kinase [Coleofasciculus sp. FACHB-125]MBD1902056.1 protein kinase [Coleofasciculus sp. FACHB-125]
MKSTNPEWGRLLTEEARVLIALSLQKYGGIPQVEPDGYFSIEIAKPRRTLQCLVMEFSEGQDLDQWLICRGNQPIPEERARDWLRQIVATLEQVHNLNLVHRDIKPSNIMLRHGQLVLIDFGIVRVEGRGLTRVGTPEYMAPEQAQGRPAVPPSDFYALGRTFVHLLTGRPPIDFQDPQTGQLIWQDSAPKISPQLKQLIDDMMAPLPERRPQSAQNILQRLAKLPPIGQVFGDQSERAHHRILQWIYKLLLLSLLALISTLAPNRGTAWRWIQSVLHPIPPNHWKIEYFNNPMAEGTPVSPPINLGRCDQSINEQWGFKSPSKTHKDNFSARITTSKCYLAPGLHLIKVKADDGIRVKIGEQIVINQFTNEQGCKEPENHYHANYFRSEGKEYQITVEYCERTGDSKFHVEIKEHKVLEESLNLFNEWKATFYFWNQNEFLEDKPPKDFYKQDVNKIGVLNLGSNQRSDSKKGIQQDWKAGSTKGHEHLATDFFAIRGYTKAYFKAGKKYRAVLNRADDGLQLQAHYPQTNQWVDITQNEWQSDKPNVFPFEVPHTGTYDLYFLYYEREGHASINFLWEEITP